MEDDQETQGEPTDFERFFAEAAEGRAKPSAPQADGDEGDQPGQRSEGEAGQDAPRTQGEAEGEADAAPKQPAKAASEQQPKPETTGSTGLTVDELERRLADALHRERSVAGRISAADSRAAQLQKENDSLRQQLQQLQSAAKAAKPPADDVLSQTPELEASIQRRITEATAELRQELDAAKSRLQQLGEHADKTASVTESAIDDRAKAEIAETQRQLDSTYTLKWRKDVQSPAFAVWLSRQTRAIQDLYESGISFADTRTVLDLYYAQSRATPPAPTPPPPSGQPQNRLRAAAGIAPRPGKPESKPDPNDFDAAFAEAAAARTSQRTRP